MCYQIGNTLRKWLVWQVCSSSNKRIRRYLRTTDGGQIRAGKSSSCRYPFHADDPGTIKTMRKLYIAAHNDLKTYIMKSYIWIKSCSLHFEDTLSKWLCHKVSRLKNPSSISPMKLIFCQEDLISYMVGPDIAYTSWWLFADMVITLAYHWPIEAEWRIFASVNYRHWLR